MCLFICSFKYSCIQHVYAVGVPTHRYALQRWSNKRRRRRCGNGQKQDRNAKTLASWKSRERRASGREQSSPLAAAAATSGKRRVQKSSLGLCNMYSAGDGDIGQDDLMLSYLEQRILERPGINDGLECSVIELPIQGASRCKLHPSDTIILNWALLSYLIWLLYVSVY